MANATFILKYKIVLSCVVIFQCKNNYLFPYFIPDTFSRITFILFTIYLFLKIIYKLNGSSEELPPEQLWWGDSSAGQIWGEANLHLMTGA